MTVLSLKRIYLKDYLCHLHKRIPQIKAYIFLSNGVYYLDQWWIPGNINLKHPVSLLFFEPGFLAWYFSPQTFQTLQTSYKHSDG